MTAELQSDNNVGSCQYVPKACNACRAPPTFNFTPDYNPDATVECHKSSRG